VAWENQYEHSVKNGLGSKDRRYERSTSNTSYPWSKGKSGTLGSSVFFPAC